MARGSQRDLATKTKGRRGNRAGGAGAGSKATVERIVLDRGVHKKAKDCEQCHRVMTWRKKWESDWDDVRFCSGSCKKAAKAAAKAAPDEVSLARPACRHLQTPPRRSANMKPTVT